MFVNWGPMGYFSDWILGLGWSGFGSLEVFKKNGDESLMDTKVSCPLGCELLVEDTGAT